MIVGFVAFFSIRPVILLGRGVAGIFVFVMVSGEGGSAFFALVLFSKPGLV